MIFNRIVLSVLLISFNSLLFGQLLFPELQGWGKEQNIMLPDDLNLTYKYNTENLVSGDTFDIKFYYPNKQLAIEGQCLIKGRDLSFSKVKIWNYYYENGKLWSSRSYTSGSGYLDSIEKLLDPQGNELSHGHGRYNGKYHIYSGYGYIYDDQGKVKNIAYYKRGSINDTYSPDRYSEEQLQRLVIREFITSDSTILKELSIEEAVELQKTVNKPILLNATTSWNGYTKKGYDRIFSNPDLAKLINDNFIFAYIDIEDTRDISIPINGTVQEFQGSTGTGHSIIKSVNGRALTSTPTFLFINSSFELEHRHTGIELKEDVFIKSIEFYLSKEYQLKSWKEYRE